MGLGHIVGMMVFGIVAGALARLFTPGQQSMGILATMFLGILGSFVGGFLGFLIEGGSVFQTSGWIGSIVGGVIVLLVTSSRATKKLVN